MAMSMFQASPLDSRAELLILAIYNPKNRDKVAAGVDEELTRLVQDGVTAAELDPARTGYLQQQAVQAPAIQPSQPSLQTIFTSAGP